VRKQQWIFIILIFSTGCGAKFVDVTKLRAPNSYEVFYQYVALNANASELCEKISPRTFLPGTMMFGAPTLVRSECYYKIATRYGRKELCNKITPIRTAAVEEVRTPASCRDEITKRPQNHGFMTYSPSADEMQQFFLKMGYQPETLHLEGLTRPLLNFKDAYAGLAKKPDLIERIKKIANPDKLSSEKVNITTEQLEYLYDMAAHVNNDIFWCKMIRDEAPHPSYDGPTSFFRDTCIFEVADNTNNSSLCADIPDRPEYLKGITDDIPERQKYFLMEAQSKQRNCYRQIAAELKLPNNLYYGYIVPVDDQIIIAIFGLLNYPLPTIKDVAEYEIPERYWDFIYAMGDEKELANKETVRKKFLKRVSALPNYKE